MIRKYDVGKRGNMQPPFKGNSLFFNPSNLFNKNFGVDHCAAGDKAVGVGIKNARGNKVKSELFSFGDNRVASVVPSLRTHDVFSAFGEKVDDFPFPFIAPLSPHNNHTW